MVIYFYFLELFLKFLSDVEYFSNYSWIFQAINSSAIGGYWVCFLNMEKLALGILSIISHKLFQIRKALVLNEKKAEIEPNLSIFLDKEVAFMGTFNYTSLKREDLPAYFLDSFRVMDYFSPDFKKVIHAYFILLGFDVFGSTQFTEKFLLFLSFINENLFKCHYMINGGLSKKESEEIFSEYQGNSFKKIGSSFGTALRIIEYCRAIFLEKKDLVKEEILWKSVVSYYKGILSTNNINIVANLFSNIFNFKNIQYLNKLYNIFIFFYIGLIT